MTDLTWYNLFTDCKVLQHTSPILLHPVLKCLRQHWRLRELQSQLEQIGQDTLRDGQRLRIDIGIISLIQTLKKNKNTHTVLDTKTNVSYCVWRQAKVGLTLFPCCLSDCSSQTPVNGLVIPVELHSDPRIFPKAGQGVLGWIDWHVPERDSSAPVWCFPKGRGEPLMQRQRPSPSLVHSGPAVSISLHWST